MILAAPIHCKFCASKYITKSNQYKLCGCQKVSLLKNICSRKIKYYSFTRSLTWINSTGLALPDYLIPWDTHLLERTILSSPAIKKIATSKKEAGLVNFLRSGCGSKCMTQHEPRPFSCSKRNEVGYFLFDCSSGTATRRGSRMPWKGKQPQQSIELSFTANNRTEIFSREP